jgi:hypothetical protein
MRLGSVLVMQTKMQSWEPMTRALEAWSLRLGRDSK